MPNITNFGGHIPGSAQERRAASAPPRLAPQPRRRRPPAPPSFNAYGNQSLGYWFERRGDRASRRLITFATRDELLAFARQPDYRDTLERLWVEVRQATNVNDGKLRRTRNMPRVGDDYRGGADVTPERFMETFRPYGVQFGVWQRDRDACLNQAYDALLDLGRFLRIQPEQVALDGTLGLAFGARGKGNAAAHYEPGHRVINLTKPHGAGCLAHEWFHAYDHRLSGAAGMSRSPALAEAYRALPTPLLRRSAQADLTRSKRYYSLRHEVLARAFEAWLRTQVENDYLANIVKYGDFRCGEGRYPYPLEQEMPTVDAAFRRLFDLA